jgi:hypothetical protein
VKYRLEATRVTADADAQMVVPHSLDLTCKTTTLHATAQSLAVSVLDLVATRAGEPAGNAIARSVELAQLGGRTSLHSGTGLLSLTGTNRTYRSRDENDSSGQRWIATVPDVMTLSEEPVPEPKDGEVLIRVGFAGVNSSDSKARSGESARAGYRVRDFKFPFVTGMGCCRCCGANGVERQWIRTRRSRDHLERCGRQNVGQLCGIHASSGEECLPEAEEPKLRSGSRCSRCGADRLPGSLPCGKGWYDTGPEGAHTRSRGWCWQLRGAICEERRVAGGSDLRR